MDYSIRCVRSIFVTASAERPDGSAKCTGSEGGEGTVGGRGVGVEIGAAQWVSLPAQ